jgi:rRNA processing protein Gar1
MDRNTELLEEIDATVKANLREIADDTKAIKAHLTKPAPILDSFMSKIGYIVTVFGVVGGLYSFVNFLYGIIWSQ